MMKRFSSNGKEVLFNGAHYADTVSEQAARRVAFAMNVTYGKFKAKEK